MLIENIIAKWPQAVTQNVNRYRLVIIIILFNKIFDLSFERSEDDVGIEVLGSELPARIICLL